MRMRRHYTPEEIQFVKDNIRGCSYINMTKLFNKRFGLRITLKQMETLTYKHEICNGVGKFRPGHVSFNRGKTHPSWKGNWKPIGSERLQGGYVFVKVSDRKHCREKHWKAKHVVIWEAVHGKVPRGHAVIFLDGNRLNFDINNLVMISKREHFVMNANHLRAEHPELTKMGRTIANLRMVIADRKRDLKKRSKAK